MQIREAKPEDYHQIMVLYNDFVEEDRYSKHDSDSFYKVIKNPNNLIYIAESKGVLIGFATLSLRNVVRYPKPIAELDELYVNPKYREKGIGRKLVEKVEQKAKQLDCYVIYIESHNDRKTAHKFYQSQGYSKYGFAFRKRI